MGKDWVRILRSGRSGSTQAWTGERSGPTAVSGATRQKQFPCSKPPVKLQAEINYYIERPDNFGSDWMISFDITPVDDNFVKK